MEAHGAKHVEKDNKNAQHKQSKVRQLFKQRLSWVLTIKRMANHSSLTTAMCEHLNREDPPYF